MKRFVVIVLALSMLITGCVEGEDGIDGEAIGEIFDAIQDAAEQAEAGNDGSNDSDGDGRANTASPTRPPFVPGGDRTETSRDEDWLGTGEARNTEEVLYGPTDASHEEIIDFYTETYGEPSETLTEGRTGWNGSDTGDGSVVTVRHDGFDTTVKVQYYD